MAGAQACPSPAQHTRHTQRYPPGLSALPTLTCGSVMMGLPPVPMGHAPASAPAAPGPPLRISSSAIRSSTERLKRLPWE